MCAQRHSEHCDDCVFTWSSSLVVYWQPIDQQLAYEVLDNQPTHLSEDSESLSKRKRPRVLAAGAANASFKWCTQHTPLWLVRHNKGHHYFLQFLRKKAEIKLKSCWSRENIEKWLLYIFLSHFYLLSPQMVPSSWFLFHHFPSPLLLFLLVLILFHGFSFLFWSSRCLFVFFFSLFPRLGAYFSPLLPLICVIKLFLFFYVKKVRRPWSYVQLWLYKQWSPQWHSCWAIFSMKLGSWLTIKNLSSLLTINKSINKLIVNQQVDWPSTSPLCRHKVR